MPKLTGAALNARLKEIRLLSLDTDGVLTDGGLYYTDDGAELRKFNVKDGMGIKLARKAGVEVAIISASLTAAIGHRGRRLGLTHVHTGVESKLDVLTSICDALGIGLDAVAHVGDDLNDMPLLGRVGLPIAVADAVAPVRATAAFVTERAGGAGAVREICDLLVAAHGGLDNAQGYGTD